MGATTGYCRPVQPVGGRVSTWRAHINRGTPSVEPGTDYYTPVGTPLKAASSGVVADIGTSIKPATGYYITLDLDDGRRVRYLHLSRIDVSYGQRVQWGQVIGLTGATGYGEYDWSWNVAETGGAHVHMTVFPWHGYPSSWNQGGKDRAGNYYTIDPETLMAADQSGGTATKTVQEEDEMTASYINLEGQAGSHRGGVFAIMRDNGGKLFARRVTLDKVDPAYPTIDASQLKAWRDTMNFLGL